MVVQDGARLHYAVPVSLARHGALAEMYTDWYVKPGRGFAAVARLVSLFDGPLGRRMLERRHPQLDPALVRTHPLLALSLPLKKKRFAHHAEFLAFRLQRTAHWLLRRRFSHDANAIFGFVRNIPPAVCEKAAREGLAVVVDQMIATRAEEQRQERLQCERFPKWKAAAKVPPSDPFLEIERETWQRADVITCASDYVRESLVREGVEPERIRVIPYPISAADYPWTDRRGRAGKVVVGFVGSLGLRKGTPYLLEVARRLGRANVTFELVGGADFDTALLEGVANVKWVGKVPRSEVHARLKTFDIFFFPSTCEGSPSAVMEAMATGLPVVTTPNSGTLVRDGVEGFVRAYDDIDGLTEAVARLVESESLRLEMGRAARERVEGVNLEFYGRQLFDVLCEAVGRRQVP
ncbi:MAG: glycosyltransferase family 4 protein [Tepidisphaerales bacterium]